MLGPGMRATIKDLFFESFLNLRWIGWICKGVILWSILASSGSPSMLGPDMRDTIKILGFESFLDLY